MSTATTERPTTATFDVSAPRYSKSPKGEWRVVGPASMVVEGPVTVVKKNGKTTVENVVGVGTTFDRGGVQCRYGYLKSKFEQAQQSPAVAVSEGNFLPDEYDNLAIEDEF